MGEMTIGPQAAQRGAETTRNAPVFLSAADIYEDAAALYLALETQGVDPDALSITLEKRRLTVAGDSRPVTPPGYSHTYAGNRDAGAGEDDQRQGRRVRHSGRSPAAGA